MKGGMTIMNDEINNDLVNIEELEDKLAPSGWWTND